MKNEEYSTYLGGAPLHKRSWAFKFRTGNGVAGRVTRKYLIARAAAASNTLNPKFEIEDGLSSRMYEKREV